MTERPQRAKPMMDRVLERPADLPPDLPRRGVGGDALLPQERCELLAPLPQCLLANVEPFAGLELMLALDHQMHVRMRLIRVQHHGVSMLQREVLARKGL